MKARSKRKRELAGLAHLAAALPPSDSSQPDQHTVKTEIDIKDLLQALQRFQKNPAALQQYDDGRFSPEDVRSLVNSVLKGKLKCPSDQALELLRLSLNWAAQFRLKYVNEWKVSSQRTEEAAQALKTVESYLEEVKLSYESERIKKAIASVESGLRLIREETFVFVPMTRHMPLGEIWHDLAESLAEMFQEAMRSTNMKELGFSKEGPVARFVASVIPFITDQRPTLSRVGQEIARASRARRSGTKRRRRLSRRDK